MVVSLPTIFELTQEFFKKMSALCFTSSSRIGRTAEAVTCLQKAFLSAGSRSCIEFYTGKLQEKVMIFRSLVVLSHVPDRFITNINDRSKIATSVQQSNDFEPKFLAGKCLVLKFSQNLC